MWIFGYRQRVKMFAAFFVEDSSVVELDLWRTNGRKVCSPSPTTTSFDERERPEMLKTHSTIIRSAENEHDMRIEDLDQLRHGQPPTHPMPRTFMGENGLLNLKLSEAVQIPDQPWPPGKNRSRPSR